VTRSWDLVGGVALLALGAVYFGLIERDLLGTALFVGCGAGLLALSRRRR
jgi:hypothetical protein